MSGSLLNHYCTLLSLALTHTWLYSLLKEWVSSRKHCEKKGENLDSDVRYHKKLGFVTAIPHKCIYSMNSVVLFLWLQNTIKTAQVKLEMTRWLTLAASCLCLSVVISEPEPDSRSASVGWGDSLSPSVTQEWRDSWPISRVDSSFSLSRR